MDTPKPGFTCTHCGCTETAEDPGPVFIERPAVTCNCCGTVFRKCRCCNSYQDQTVTAELCAGCARRIATGLLHFDLSEAEQEAVTVWWLQAQRC